MYLGGARRQYIKPHSQILLQNVMLQHALITIESVTSDILYLEKK